jgi:hypothetical protein
LRVAFTYTDGDRNRNSDGNSISNANSNGQTYSNSKTGSYAAATSHTCASAVNLGSYTRLSSGNSRSSRVPESLEFFISERVKPNMKGGTATAATPERIWPGRAITTCYFRGRQAAKNLVLLLQPI